MRWPLQLFFFDFWLAELLFLFPDSSLEASDVFFAYAFFPFANTRDYFTEVVLEFFVCYATRAFNAVHNVCFLSACSYGYEYVVFTHGSQPSGLVVPVLDLRRSVIGYLHFL